MRRTAGRTHSLAIGAAALLLAATVSAQERNRQDPNRQDRPEARQNEQQRDQAQDRTAEQRNRMAGHDQTGENTQQDRNLDEMASGRSVRNVGDIQRLQRARDLMQQNSTALADAIKKAESQTGGKAVFAQAIVMRPDRMHGEQRNAGRDPGMTTDANRRDPNQRNRDPGVDRDPNDPNRDNERRADNPQNQTERDRLDRDNDPARREGRDRDPALANRDREMEPMEGAGMQSGDMGAGGELAYQVGCLTKDDKLVVVTVSGQSGEVVNSRNINRVGSGSHRNDSWTVGNYELTAFQIRKASDLIGTDVRNLEGKDVGSIEDLAIDPQNGKIRYAALSFGGFLGMGDKLFAIPWDALQLRSDNYVYIDVNKESFKNNEGFNKDNWPASGDARWVRGGGDAEYRLVADEQNPNRPGANQAKRGDRDERGSGTIARASHLIGLNVKNHQGEKLGDIQDLAIDSGNGKICYAILSHGGFLGIGDKLVAVPWMAFENRAPKSDHLVLNADKQRLENAPNYSKNEEAQRISDADWVVTVYTYYNQEPYWQQDDTRRAERDRDQNDRRGTDGDRDRP